MVALQDEGLNANASGNASVRVAEGILVTPSGIPAGAMHPQDCVLLDNQGQVRDGHRTPTSEWRIHVGAMARPDIGAVVHTHSLEATAASTGCTALPAVHYVVARFGATKLPCADYATYGSAELSDHVMAALGPSGTACLMANHGALMVGPDLDSAVALAVDVEWFCGVHRRAVAQGQPAVLSDEEIRLVAERFTRYGQPT